MQAGKQKKNSQQHIETKCKLLDMIARKNRKCVMPLACIRPPTVHFLGHGTALQPCAKTH